MSDPHSQPASARHSPAAFVARPRCAAQRENLSVETPAMPPRLSSAWGCLDPICLLSTFQLLSVHFSTLDDTWRESLDTAAPLCHNYRAASSLRAAPTTLSHHRTQSHHRPRHLSRALLPLDGAATLQAQPESYDPLWNGKRPRCSLAGSSSAAPLARPALSISTESSKEELLLH